MDEGHQHSCGKNTAKWLAGAGLRRACGTPPPTAAHHAGPWSSQHSPAGQTPRLAFSASLPFPTPSPRLPPLRPAGQALVDSITAAVFNVVFTSMPILLFAILDRPVKNLNAFIRYPQVGVGVVVG